MSTVEEPRTSPAERDEQRPEETVAADDLVAVDLLVEDVSIDGMCGVY